MNTSSNIVDVTPLLDNHTTYILTYIIFTVLCQSVNVFGIVSNGINIVCFVKQGFQDTVNISIFGLAISDLASLLTSSVFSISFTPAFREMDLPFDVLGVNYAVASIPHITFSRVTSWITAIITTERCLCVILPLKVKRIVTPRRMWLIIAGAFIVFILCSAPTYVVSRLGVKFFPAKNRTLIALIASPDKDKVEMISFIINSFILPCLAFIHISVCTVILVYNLHRQTKWRNLSTAGSTSVPLRNQKVIKMVVVISVLFIICNIPMTIIMLAVAFVPGLSNNGRYLNVGIVIAGIGLLFESINSSANILIYYHMSSNYKEAFQNIFRKRKCSIR